MSCACGCGQTPPLWTKSDFAKGRVKGQHMTCVPGHRRAPSVSASDRFWAKVTGAAADACWEWNAYVMPNGYGQFGVAPGRVVLAHRWAYESLRSTIPPGLDIDHLCENRRCVNPWHLEPVTRSVNLARQERNSGRTNNKEYSAS